MTFDILYLSLFITAMFLLPFLIMNIVEFICLGFRFCSVGDGLDYTKEEKAKIKKIGYHLLFALPLSVMVCFITSFSANWNHSFSGWKAEHVELIQINTGFLALFFLVYMVCLLFRVLIAIGNTDETETTILSDVKDETFISEEAPEDELDKMLMVIKERY